MHRFRRSTTAIALLSLLLLSSPAWSDGGEADRWLPADVGNRWAYVYARERVRETASGEEHEVFKGTRVDEVVGHAAGFARGSVEIHSVVRGRTEDAPTETIERSRLFVLPSANGLRMVARETPNPVTGEIGLSRFDPPLERIRAGARSGEHWTPGSEERGALRTDYEGEILGLQSARTPAGLFESCLVVRTVGTLSGEAELYGTSIELEEGRVTTVEWYAPGVGLVLSKSEIDQSLRLSDGTALEIHEKTQFALSKVDLAQSAMPPAAPAVPAAPDAEAALPAAPADTEVSPEAIPAVDAPKLAPTADAPPETP